MKRFYFWTITALATFALGLVAFYVWIAPHFAPHNEVFVEPPLSVETPVYAGCSVSRSFPGLSVEFNSLATRPDGNFPKSSLNSRNEKSDIFRDTWYGKHLAGMQEPSLVTTNNGDKESYRFLWLRSFHHAIAVRIERDGGQINLFVKENNGFGGYEPRDNAVTLERKISEVKWCEFLTKIDEADFWQLGEKVGLANDGAQWILEGVKNKRYHVVDRQSPENGKYREACLYLLELSGLKVEESDIY